MWKSGNVEIRKYENKKIRKCGNAEINKSSKFNIKYKNIHYY